MDKHPTEDPTNPAELFCFGLVVFVIIAALLYCL